MADGQLDGALPKTAWVCEQWVRCGRSNCRCARGKLHAPYAYLFWREGGRLRKRYVPASTAPALRAALRAMKERRDWLRAQVRAARQQWRDLVKVVRDAERDEAD
jgi:hypothetical protein